MFVFFGPLFGCASHSFTHAVISEVSISSKFGRASRSFRTLYLSPIFDFDFDLEQQGRHAFVSDALSISDILM